MSEPNTAKARAAESLLVELLTEELPPQSLRRLSAAFGGALAEHLRDGGFIGDKDEPKTFATPRRLAALIPNVLPRQPDSVVERKGPSLQAGLDDGGNPTPALLGFARSCGVEQQALRRRTDEKGEYFVYRSTRKGESLNERLAGYVAQALQRLPVARVMRWSGRDDPFVRPVHALVMLHGSRVVPGEVLRLKSGNRTRGHRFMSRGPVAIRRAQDYEKTLRAQGHVIASFDARREVIVAALDRAAASFGRGLSWRLGKDAALVEEVTSIVESPSVHAGTFDSAFLDVPRECLIVSMQQHQKYFPLADAAGRLQPRFLFVANIQPRDPRPIVHGNERVLRARLADAKFFYDQDRKQRLADRVPELEKVIYLAEVGNQLERTLRIKDLARRIAMVVGADVSSVERAAYLSRADTLTHMVGEFPELQGVMGRYYAEHDGEAPEVARAIEDRYRPRFAGDQLPEDPASTALALADKLELLVAVFAIGAVPTGEKDPYGLRRAALGVVRILVEQRPPIDLGETLEHAYHEFRTIQIWPGMKDKLLYFLYDRLRPYLREKGYAADEIEAVLALRPTRLDQVAPRLEAIRAFRAAPEGQALAAANKRIQNILRQAGGGDPDRIAPAIDGALFREPAEEDLARRLAEVAARVHPLTAAGDYAGALKELSGLRAPVDTFFDKVLVMVDDEGLRTARLQLLAQIRREFREIADVSKLQG